MNRIEIVGLFTMMKRMLEKEDIEGVKMAVDAVLREAETRPLKNEIEND